LKDKLFLYNYIALSF